MLARSPTVHNFNAPLKAPWLKQKEEQRLKDLERDRRARAGQFGALAEEDSDDDDEQEPPKLKTVTSPEMSKKEKARLIGFRNGTLSWADVESDDEFEEVGF